MSEYVVLSAILFTIGSIGVLTDGYARDTEDTVDIHVSTLRVAAELRSSSR